MQPLWVVMIKDRAELNRCTAGTDPFVPQPSLGHRGAAVFRIDPAQLGTKGIAYAVKQLRLGIKEWRHDIDGVDGWHDVTGNLRPDRRRQAVNQPKGIPLLTVPVSNPWRFGSDEVQIRRKIS